MNKNTKLVLPFTWSAALLAAAGCDASRETLAETEAEIHGVLSFGPGCTSQADRDKITEAVAWTRGRVTRPQFAECLRLAYLIDEEGSRYEEIAEWSSTDLPVVINCVDSSIVQCGGGYGWAGCAGGTDPDDPESFSLDYSFIQNAAISQIGGTILHEILHNHHYWHPHSVGFAVSDQVSTCVRGDAPSGTRRDSMGDEVQIAHAGGQGGSPSYSRCGSDHAAIGIRSVVSSGSLVQLALQCGRVEGDSITDDHADNLSIGGGAIVDRCPSGQVLVGIAGWQDDMVRGVQAACAPLSDVKADLPGQTVAWFSATRGNASGDYFVRICDNAKVVTGIDLRTGALVDRAGLICDGFPIGRSRGTRDLATPSAGGTGGGPFERYCQGNAVLSGFYGSRNSAGRLASLGGSCRPMSGEVVTRGFEGVELHRLDAAGQQSGTNFNFLCNTGDVVVGFRARSESFVNGMVPVCASFASWVADGTSYAVAGLAGAGTQVEHLCPAGYVATGFAGREGALIDQLQLRCERPEPAIVVSQSAAVGGTGGAAFEKLCPGGSPLQGLETIVEGQLTGAGGYCAITRGDQIHEHDGYRLGVYGARGSSVVDRCGNGQMLVGLEARVSGSIVRGVRGVCRSRATVLAGGTEQELLPWRGTFAGATVSTAMCPIGQVAIGLSGRAGALIDRLRLFCGRPELELGESYDIQLAAGASALLKYYRPTEGGELHTSVSWTSGSPEVIVQRRDAPADTFKLNPSSAGGANYPINSEWRAYTGLFPEDHYLLRVTNEGSATATFTVEMY